MRFWEWAYTGHGLPVIRLKSLLNQMKLVASNTPRIFLAGSWLAARKVAGSLRRSVHGRRPCQVGAIQVGGQWYYEN